jgi:hypothetical protein
MSYLDVPRFHFAGEFLSDPSTANNSLGSCCDPLSSAPHMECSYNPAVTIDGNPALELWNKDGRHHFSLRGCTVRSAVDVSGAVSARPDQDSLVTGTIEVDGFGRLVDVDPAWQTSSQIFGLTLRVADTGGSGFTAAMATATLRELWARRRPGGFSEGLGGVYQSVLTNVAWNPEIGPLRSPVLEALRSLSRNRLSIKFVVYAYQATAGPGFTVGRIVGTIGPALAGEPDHIPNARVLIHSVAAGEPFGTAHFRLDAARQRLVVDLGNAIPELASGARRPLGTLEAQIDLPAPQGTVTLGSLGYDERHYVRSAGIEEVPVTAAQGASLASAPLRIRATASPAAPRLVLAERSPGVEIDASQVVVRLNPGEDARVDLLARRFGAPASGVEIGLEVIQGDPATGLTVLSGTASPPAPVALPGRVLTPASGEVALALRAGDPGHPRAHMDGQVYVLGLFLGPCVAANRRGQIVVRVYERHAIPANPTWTDVRDILTQYFRLYGSMRFIDLGDHAIVKSVRGPIAAALRRAETDPRYMPVSRDLSRDKRDLLLRWLDAGAPP